MMLHNYKPQPTYNQITITPMVSEMSPRQEVKAEGDYDKVKGQNKIIPWRCTMHTPTNDSFNY